MGRLLIANADPGDRDRLGSALAGEGRDVCYAETASQTLKQASQQVPDLILLDAAMPDMDGLEVCRHLRLDPLLAEVPILLITATEPRVSCLPGLQAGADDVLGKPLNLVELQVRVQNILRLNRYRKLFSERTANERLRVEREASFESALLGWARALELRGVEPEGHTQRVTRMTLRLARAHRVPESAHAAIRWGALLHDSGKCGVPDAALASGNSAKSRAAVRKHPEYAHDLFAGTDALQAVIEIPHCHHERWDGTGYPRGLRGEQIPLAARIFAVADAWDMLTSASPCGKGWTKAFARQQILEQAGKRFDPDVVRTFATILTPDDMAEWAAPLSPDEEARLGARAGARPSRRLTSYSLVSRGARLHFLAALTLISIMPALAFLYMAVRGHIGSAVGWTTLIPLAVAVVVLMTLGYVLLAKYPANVVRLRRWAEGLAKGDLPVRVDLSTDETDLAAIERSLREVVRQSQQRVQTLELQTEALLDAERQRVAIEGLGAACHHLGQPATSLSISLYMIRRANTAPEIVPLIDQCQQAADAMAEVLQKLQHIASYRSEPYLVSCGSVPAADNRQILKL